MSQTAPGSCGCPVISDKSYEFVQDPVKFIEKRINNHSSRIFQSRLLNNPTVFLCSPSLIHELLAGENSLNFQHGYRSFLHRVFGDLILFETEEDAAHLRECFTPIFEDFQTYRKKTKKKCNTFVNLLKENRNPIDVYSELKSLMTQLCLELFLNLDENSSQSLIKEITELTTQHWHGIISVPISLNLPVGHQSTYSLAMEAREKLLFEIRNILIKHYCEEKTESLFDRLRKVIFPKQTDLEQHLLFFSSALIPKAFSSIITSFLLEMAGDERVNDRKKARNNPDYLEDALLEVERLWPPVFGGRRLATKSTVIGNYKIPKDYAVIYMIYSSNRDPSIFPDPDKFNPERWSTCNKNQKDMVCTYGLGRRCCIGTKFIRSILFDTIQLLVQNFDWELYPPNQDVGYKYLPVCRPKNDITIKFDPV